MQVADGECLPSADTIIILICVNCSPHLCNRGSLEIAQLPDSFDCNVSSRSPNQECFEYTHPDRVTQWKIYHAADELEVKWSDTFPLAEMTHKEQMRVNK